MKIEVIVPTRINNKSLFATTKGEAGLKSLKYLIS